MALAALWLPGVAWGGSGAAYTSTLVGTVPTLDGVITGPEWSNTPVYNVTFGNFPATVRFVHTATDLYVGVVVQDATPGSNPAMSVFFDNNDDGIKNPGDDAWLAFLGGSASDFYYSPTGTGGASHYNDTVGGGTNETTAAVQASGGAVTYEIKHPLCSADIAHDICAVVGGTYGIDFQYENATGFSNAPGLNLFDPSNWPNLTLSSSDTTSPTVTWVQPANGNVDLSGITTLTVNASDNVGVDHVTFDYYDGTTTHVLGTVSQPPYSIQFNTWQFPDVATNAATIYAQSFDAAGNQSIHTGLGIGINNGQTTNGGSGTIHGAVGANTIFVVRMVPNATVTGNVAAPGQPGVPWSLTTDSGGNGGVASPLRLATGFTITATDGVNNKRLTLVPIQISSVDYAKNTASGSGPGAGAEIRVTLFNAQGVNLGFDFTTTNASNNWTVQFSAARGRQVAPGDYIIADTPDADQDRTRADFAVNPDQYAVSIAGDQSSQAGVGSLALTGPNAIPVNLITGAPGGPAGTGLGGIGLGGIGLGGIGLGGIGLGGIGLGGITIQDLGLGGIGLGGIGLGGIGLGGIGLGGIGLGGIPILDQNGLGGVPLSTIPLKLPDSWQAHLDNDSAFRGKPPQSVTLAQVINDPTVIGDIKLKDLDLSGSGLGGIGLGGIALGGIGLGGIGLGGISDGAGGYYGGSQTATNLQGWCDYINRQPGHSCTDSSTLAGATVMSIALGGIGLGGIPFEKIGLGGIDLHGTGLGGIPVEAGLGGIGLGGINLTGTALGGIGLGGINWNPTGLGGIGLGGITIGSLPAAGKAAILTCPTGTFTCPATATLAQAAAAGAINPGATVQDIGYYCYQGASSGTATWCNGSDNPILLADFVKNLPSTVTIADLLAALLPQPATDWEQLPLIAGLQDYSSDGGVVTYTVSYRGNSAGTNDLAANIQVVLPDGSRFVSGSTTSTATLSQDAENNDPDFDPLANTVTWHATFAPNTPQTLTFKVKPGLELATENATAKVILGSGEIANVVATSSPTSTSITQTYASDPIGTPQAIAPDKLYFGYTPNGTDRDYFSLPLPDAGTKVTVHLGHLKVDDDLVVFTPTVDPLRTPHPGTSPTLVPNVDPSLQPTTQPIQPEVLNDVPVTPPSGQSVAGVSDNRGLADEEVTFIAPEHAAGATATIQVSSYNGDYSNAPWTLRVEESPALPLPTTCQGTPTLTTGGGTTMTLPSSVGGNTLYLFNSKRFGDIYGGDQETAVWNNLKTLAARSDGAGGTVIPIDAVGSIATALNGWYSNACSPGASNAVVRAIGAYLDTLPTTYKYVVIVGGWDVTPPGLVLDNTSYVNEREYATTFYGANNNQYLSDYALGYLPTDDPYGDTNYSGQGAYVPDVGVGRLIETPGQINAQITQYIGDNGAISPTTALVTGYDFLSDGSQQVAAALPSRVSTTQLINDSWTRDQLIADLFPSGGQIDVVNAHYDHHRSLPAVENATGGSTNLFQTGDVQATANRLVITLGCHSGVSVSDALFGAVSPISPDWAQTYASQGAIGYVANTGFGLGETAGVAYSERLQVLLAQRLDGSLSLGQALAFAKQEYAGSVPTTSGYQLKVLDEAELYGLPQYQVGTPPTPGSQPQPQPVTTDPVTGLAATNFDFGQSYDPNSSANGAYYTAGGLAAYEDRRPIEPLVKRDVTEPNLVAHGAVLTGLTSTDAAVGDAAFSRVVDDLTSASPELTGETTYPTKLQSISTFNTPNGTRQRLLLFGGQFHTASSPTAKGSGTQRLFGHFTGLVLYAAPGATDFTAPTFGPVSVASPTTSTVAFAVDVTDDSGANGVKRVVALYRDGSGSWQSIDLSRSGTTTRWSGTGAFTGPTVEWFIQAVDGSGNVGVTSNKADLKAPTPPSSGSLTATITGTQTNSWFTSNATVSLSGAPSISYSLDGAPFVAFTASFTVGGTGVHTLAFQGSDGSTGFAVIPIDVTPPTISIPLGVPISSSTLPVVCADAGSGIASCVTTPSPPDLSPGTHTVHVVATDRVGNTASKDGTYVVDTFTGFFQPVDNPPTVNVAKAGSAIPVKFSLGLNLGLSIFQPNYPLVQTIACDSTAPQDAIDQTVTANASGLAYDTTTNQYTYTWKTSSAWAGTCRQLVMKLTDGSQHVAYFKFK